MPTEIAVPFRLDGNGRVVTTSDPDAQVRQHVLALINTIPEERAMVPGYGTDLLGVVFEDEEEVEAQVSIRVKDSMRVHEPGVELIRAAADPESSDEGFAKVSLEYRRLDAPDSATLANANMAVVGANGVVREVVRG
jgi:phage baseplate assembly protein W